MSSPQVVVVTPQPQTVVVGGVGMPGPPGPGGTGIADATSTTKGAIRLANELAGTADNPELADPAVNLSSLFANSLA